MINSPGTRYVDLSCGLSGEVRIIAGALWVSKMSCSSLYIPWPFNKLYQVGGKHGNLPCYGKYSGLMYAATAENRLVFTSNSHTWCSSDNPYLDCPVHLQYTMGITLNKRKKLHTPQVAISGSSG